ncbi:MAG: dehydrogenase with different specificity (related to short-chain alcohol dehydrogenase)-like, partial [Ramlibacter sp.]|nr:dehydrogenase with different specificity (related to short-chain alcohol dehydrogenase)-like [Ramlibacter sp.]
MSKKPSAKNTPRSTDTEPAAEKQRALQREQDRKEPAEGGGKEKEKDKGAVQTSARHQPEEVPAQHLQKPGQEKDMELKPRFLAPDYRGSGKLKGMVALITGGDSGIGRAVAVLFAREGADVAIVYLSSHDDAQETRGWVEKEGRQCILIPGDVKDSKFC